MDKFINSLVKKTLINMFSYNNSNDEKCKNKKNLNNIKNINNTNFNKNK